MDSGPAVTAPVETRVNAVIQALRERGHRLTPQRLAIVRAFLGREDHPTAEAILEQIRGDFPMVAPSTVYHTLHTLVDLGEAVEVAPAAPHARFDPNTDDHCHLICLACNSITDVPLEQCHRPIEDSTLLKQHDFEPALRVYQISGVCSRCRKADRPA
ncbi:MAG: transcriptional repressor [Armatimonadetes bacterium]|nr:transcriptional repressor [Armatimonadota bacterium]